MMESRNSLDLEEIVSIELDSTTNNVMTNNNDNDNNDDHQQQQNSTTTNSNQNIQQIFSERIRMAAKSIQTGDYTAAIRLYSEALKLDHSNHIVYGNRSAVYCRLGRYDKALHDANKARDLCPNWSKAYYRQGIALQFLQRYPDALAAFASGLAKESKSTQLLSAFVETAMKSPLRATLEPIYRQLQVMNFDKSPFVITSVVGQELLAATHFAAAVTVLESALQIGSCSLKLRGSVFSALSTAYWSLNNLDQAIDYMQQDLQVARTLGDILGECRAHANLGSAYFAKCSYREALSSHRYQLVLAMKHKHNDQAALALTSLGHVYSAIGDLKNALSSHQQCLQIIRQLGGDPLAEAREIGNVGSVHLAAGEFDKAIEYHLEHVKLSKLLGNKSEEARAYSNLGSAYHYRRQYEQAIQFHEQVLRISQELGDRIIESKAYAGLGHASRCMKDFIQAKRWYERQLDAALNTKDRLAEAKACSNLGIVYQLLGDLDGSLKLHWSHLNICKQLNDQQGIGRAYGNIGNVYSTMKQPDEAMKYYKMELEISKELQDRSAEAAAHGSLALCFESLHLMDQALKHLNLHLNIAREINDLQNESQALCNLGNFYHSNQNYEKAIHYFEQYLQTTTALNDKDGQTNASHYLGLANLASKQYQSAMKYFQLDLEQSKQLQDRQNICRAYYHLGLVYSAIDNFDSALECYRNFLCLTSQQQNDERLKVMGYIGDILIKQAKYMEAKKILEKKLSISRSMGECLHEAMALQSLGNCQRISGDWEQAVEFFQQELQIRQSSNLVTDDSSLEVDEEMIRCLNDLGECYLKIENYRLAYECFCKQLEKCEQFYHCRIDCLNEASGFLIEYDSNGYYGRRQQRQQQLQQFADNNNNVLQQQQLKSCQMLAQALNNLAVTKFQMNHYEESISFYERQSTLIRETIERFDNHQTSTSIISDAADDHRNVNGQTEMSSTTTIIDNLIVSNTNCSRSIGDCYFAQRRYDDAIKFYLDFLSASKSLSDQEQIYCLLGKCYQLINNLQQSLVSYEKRLVIAHEIGCNQTKALAYGELGHLHRLLGNYEQSISCFKHEQELGKITNLNSNGQNDDDQHQKQIGLLIEAEALHGLGQVAQEMHDYERSLKYHSSALTIAQEIGSLEMESRAYGAIGNAYNALGNPESAIRYQEKYLSVARIIGDLNAQVSALSSLGKINSSNSNYHQARRYFQQALTIVENRNNQTRIGYRDEEEARICYELGMVLWAMNELQVAETHLRRSVDLIENLQNLNSSATQLMIEPMMMTTATGGYGSNTSDASSTTSSSNYDRIRWQNLPIMPTSMSTISQSHHHHQHYLHYQGASYEALIKILIALQRPTEALLIAERSRTRSFSKSKKNSGIFSNITTIDQIVDMARSQHAAILYYSMTIDGSYNSWLITPNQVDFASLLKTDREKILQLINSVQNSLFNQESLSIDYRSSIDDYPDTATFERYRWHLNHNWPGFSSASTALYDILIGPFQNQLNENESTINQLLLVLDGDLFLVPWNMLRNKDEQFLSERYSLLVIPSLNVLRGDQNNTKNKFSRKKSDDYHSTITSLVVANPTMPNKLTVSRANDDDDHNHHNNHRPQLYFENPASSKEAAFVSELLSTRPLIGTEANKEAVLAQLSTAQCIHFSSYIIDNTDGDPLKMATGLGIAISPSDVLIGDSAHQLHDHEYLLTPHDLISIGLSAKLVVISCPAISSRSTNHAAALNAATTYNSSQVLKTITSALLQAGASCVLLTLWPVSLNALQVLFRIFYCSLLQGTRVSTALKEAVSTIQNTTHFSHPRNWAGFILIGSDVRLSSQVALMSSSLATLIKTPEKSRDAMRVVLHLVEKSLQRIQCGQKNAMYTTVQSIDNKVGINTKGWRELLIAVGFRFEPASSTNGGLPACVFFPQSDPNGRLQRCSNALQAILALSPATIAAVSKLIANSSDYVGQIIDKLEHIINYGGQCNDIGQSSLLGSYLETLNLKLWSIQGCHELYASLGFDLMEVGTDSVTLRAGKNANFRTIMFTFRSLQALIADTETDDAQQQQQNNNQDDHKADTESMMIKKSENDERKQIDLLKTKSLDVDDNNIHTRQSSNSSTIKSANSYYQCSKMATSSSIIAESSPGSRGFSIGRNPLDVELIEMKLKSMPTNINTRTMVEDLQSTTSSQSSIATSNTVLNRQLSSYT
ncbi:Tetratricopeptide repeat protein 28 [Dermatophagoides pteronyssinus]|uniref:Tetratricopeptide repeat protein 28 n=1 Tax=Dermatophagoides pteronyssinus TaxID=6956 RepID=A0ABQ8J9G4_DERPT|nr:Tetratricopeptide repeat protein 28 [Dermatophagoides pteronyssinus]